MKLDKAWWYPTAILSMLVAYPAYNHEEYFRYAVTACLVILAWNTAWRKEEK